MIILEAYPPNYDAICEAFPAISGMKNVVFTYGSTIYNPSGNGIPHNLKMHEQEHYFQQVRLGISLWWAKYLSDNEFRLSQEVEAYRAQYRSLSKPDREKYIRKLAGDLSGPMYGNMIDFKEAKRLIRA